MSDLDATAAWIRRTVAALGLEKDVASAFVDARVPLAVAERVFRNFQKDVDKGRQPRGDAYWLLGTAITFKAADAWLATLPRWRGYELVKRAGGVAAARSWLRKFTHPPAPRSGAAGATAHSQAASIDARWAEVVDQLNCENASASNFTIRS
jgi:hypothetical protein